jgi:nitronate monooxygenase
VQKVESVADRIDRMEREYKAAKARLALAAA